ncbi:MAG: hypothetical protein HY318_15720 [Armatimonadetes bacterium]|nr:hypothetical protein [Armatimonadota bacterium]
MTERAVAVVPEAVHGETIYVAVCAYRQGEAVASSNILRMTYRPGLVPSATAAAPLDVGSDQRRQRGAD